MGWPVIVPGPPVMATEQRGRVAYPAPLLPPVMARVSTDPDVEETEQVACDPPAYKVEVPAGFLYGPRLLGPSMVHENVVLVLHPVHVGCVLTVLTGPVASTP